MPAGEKLGHEPITQCQRANTTAVSAKELRVVPLQVVKCLCKRVEMGSQEPNYVIAVALEPANGFSPQLDCRLSHTVRTDFQPGKGMRFEGVGHVRFVLEDASWRSNPGSNSCTTA